MNLSKPYGFTLVTLDSDDEAERPNDIKNIALDGHSITDVTGASLESQIEIFESSVKKYLNSIEYQKVAQKLRKRIGAISDRYKNSSRLQQFIKEKSNQIRIREEELQKRPDRIFIEIKSILDELTKYGSRASSTPASIRNDDKSPCSSKHEDGPNIEEPNTEAPPNTQIVMTDKQIAKRRRHVKRLEKAIMECGQEISKLEDAEVDLNDLDNENSAYLTLSKFKRRYMQLYRRIAAYKELNSSLERRQDKKFKTEASRIPEINKRIEKRVNNGQFPDFMDIFKLYSNYYEEKNLVVKKEVMQEEGKIRCEYVTN